MKQYVYLDTTTGELVFSETPINDQRFKSIGEINYRGWVRGRRRTTGGAGAGNTTKTETSQTQGHP